jgi:DNA-directed RNA polymerase specialized sigma24 family protein
MDKDVFNTDRPLLFSIAYRMLGSASDAEDVLQDAWLRYRGVDRSTIRSPKAFATTIVTRLCLDRLKSAQTARQDYIGPWLPEPMTVGRFATKWSGLRPSIRLRQRRRLRGDGHALSERIPNWNPNVSCDALAGQNPQAHPA